MILSITNGERYKGKGNPNPSKTILVYKDGILVGKYDSLNECCNLSVSSGENLQEIFL